MDDKTFIATYVAKEAERINQKLKDMVGSETPPTDQQRDDVIKDIEVTLSRLQSALSQLSIEPEDGEGHDKPAQ